MKQMKTIFNLFLLLFVSLSVFSSCEDDDEDLSLKDDVLSSVGPVAFLRAEATENENELLVSWTNPSNKDVIKVELSYRNTKSTARSFTASPILIDVTRDTESTRLIKVPEYATYEITAIAINKAGKRSVKESILASPYEPEEGDKLIPVFMERADAMMTSVMTLYFGKSSRDCWNSVYPNATGPYWDGDALVWGQGSGLSGFVAIREAATGLEGLQQKYANMTDRMYNSINRFITTDNGKKAYAVYPANGNDRFYDDNVWIGLDMADLFAQTKDTRYLEKSKMVWDYLMTGNDDTCGGGIYWKEMNEATDTKHTCSTAPTAVLGCKLYTLTNEKKYLDKAVELYKWLQTYLQDPDDNLYWDCIGPDMQPSKAKYTYNTGQPMQAACLLHKLTGEAKYLTDAQNLAKAAYKKWFIPFNSYALGESFNILEPGHVWFQAIMLRGYVELYKIDKNRTYLSAYEKTLTNAWLSNCRNPETNLLNGDFRGGTTQTSWEILHEGACIEMLARLAALERDGL